MAKKTKIQWCDSTANPIMACHGCELFPKNAGVILEDIDREMREHEIEGWARGTARQIYGELISEAWQQLLDSGHTPGPGHINRVTTTNVYHLRKRFRERVASVYGKKAGRLGQDVVERHITCYAAKLHLNRGHNILKPDRKTNRGYAPTFEQVTQFPGRMRDAAKWSDLLGTDRAEKPWADGLPRLIFVSDMGDAFSRRKDFDFLQREVEEIISDKGQRHLWLWLTKRPEQMQRFADSIGGMPSNICALATVTSHDTLHRVDALRQVDARVRGLSLEPLWSDVSEDIDLSGIDWVICGGESGAKKHIKPFPVEWAERLHARCEQEGVAFFLKQVGGRPTRDGAELSLSHKHGGDWDEWDTELCVREFPEYFHEYRQEELV